MNLSSALSKHESELLQTLLPEIKKFCEQQLWPLLEEDDEKRVFRPEIVKALGDLGVCGPTTPEEYGGAGLSYLFFTHILEELARTSVSYAVTLSVSGMVQSILATYGTEEQKKKFLPRLALGEEIGAFALSESHAGSDAASLKTKAEKMSDHFVLNGRKMWITSAGVAQTYVVMARTSDDGARGISAFILRSDDEGVQFGKNEKKMGWKSSPTRELILENVKIPSHRLLGKVGDGFKIAMSALDRGRFTIGAIGVGLAQEALERSVHYSLLRQQFGSPLFEFQGLQFMMADMDTEIVSSRLLVREAARLFDQGIINQKISAMAKSKATDTAMKVTTDAVQIFGGVGYTQEFPLERFMRDAKVLQIVEGTNQIQRIVIARGLKKELQS